MLTHLRPKSVPLTKSSCRFLFLMEHQEEKKKKDHVHYNHTDPCKYARWTARESFQFMCTRPWHQVDEFYSNAVNGSSSLSSLFNTQTGGDCDDDAEIPIPCEGTEFEGSSGKARSGRWARLTFKIILSYQGNSFDGWQKQPGLNTVQGLVESSIGKFVDEKKAQVLKDKGLPLEGCALVAGRTDKGVTALQQVCSFHTWRKDVKPCDIEDAINSAAPEKLRVKSVSKVSRAFHPNFSAKWRRYLYIFPLNNGEDDDDLENDSHNKNSWDQQINENGDCNDGGAIDDSILSNEEEPEIGEKSQTFSVSRVDQLLRKLEGKLLSYKMFARDTKASRNEGPPTECFIYQARATRAMLPSVGDNGEGIKVMCVELVANRFLRRMVRVLVATSIREASAGAGEDALLKLMDASCRRATAPPAPPQGLCLVNVGYTEFDHRTCFIPKD